MYSYKFVFLYIKYMPSGYIKMNPRDLKASNIITLWHINESRT